MTLPGWLRSRPDQRLGFRLAVLLSVAMLPLGVIAVKQTLAIANEAAENASDALIGLTNQAASDERQLIQTGFGAAEALAGVIRRIDPASEVCAATLRDFVAATDGYIFAGFIEADGRMRCASRGEALDFSERDDFRGQLSEPHRDIAFIKQGAVTGEAVIVMTVPVMDGDSFAGLVSLSMPHFAFAEKRIEDDPRLIELITFNSEGEILVSFLGEELARVALPRDRSLKAFVGTDRAAFAAADGAGRQRIYTVVPVVREQVYALGVWLPEDMPLGSRVAEIQSFAFPILMWAASLLVAYFAVHRLVLRHLRRLQGRMRAIGRGQRNLRAANLDGAPLEIREMSETLDIMAETIARDEAELENSLHEKDVLLKEVHHRVKNNLQLIASMINMQIRQAWAPEAKFALRRIQDRVMGLSTIHRSLYQTTTLSEIRADRLVAELTNQMAVLGTGPGKNFDISMDLAEVTLYPDQAVPLALLATEAVTNALKYAGRPAQGVRPQLSLRMQTEGEAGEVVVLEIVNSKGIRQAPDAPEEAGTGLGARLIDAFAAQLDATKRVEETDDSYTLFVRFTIAGFSPDPGEEDMADYPGADDDGAEVA